MPEGNYGLDVTFKAAADLSSYQYCFVYISAANTVTYCGANGRVLGILQNKPDAANESAVVRIAGRSLLKVNEECAVGKLLTSTSAGLGEIVDAAGEFVGAIAHEAATAQNDLITVEIAKFTAHASDA